MSAITFLASSKPFNIPDEIQEYKNRLVFERMEDLISLWVSELNDDGWAELVKGLFTLPYIYELSSADHPLFLIYLEKYMEEGDVLELLHFPNQHEFENDQRRLIEGPEPVIINVGSLTYQNKYGDYTLNAENWVEELSHKKMVTEHGVTTIIKY